MNKSCSNHDYSYFGASPDSCTGYDSDISVWLSVDPLADKYPSMSAYMYTAGNPVMLVDPDGRDWFKDSEGNVQWFEGATGDFSDIETHKEWTHIGETYELPDGSGTLGKVHFRYGEDRQLDVQSGQTASPLISIEFAPSKENEFDYGNWVQTYSANSTPHSDNIYDESIVSDTYLEYIDGSSTSGYYNDPNTCAATNRNPLYLEDMPARAAAVETGQEVGMHFTSSVVVTKNNINTKVVSVTWGFTISKDGYVKFDSFRIVNGTSEFHNNAVKNAKP